MGINYELIALDVDGTLLTDDHELLGDVKEAVREASQRGAEIVLCTGRGPMGALPVLEELGLSGTLITHNGAATIQSFDRAVLFQYDIDQTYIGEFINYCRENNIHYDLNTAFEMYVEMLTPETKAMYEFHNVQPTLMSIDQRLPDKLVKLTLFGTKESMDEVQSYWEKRSPNLQIIRSGDLFIDVQHPGASKGEALRQLAEGRSIAREKILAIGNYYNDISMLQFAGIGIAMSNSPDMVKEAADAVVGSNNESGVAAAIRHYALK
ncbi:Cof-type HAD-IIB family hydrolase [Paenibacillus sp. L3-i20]|uniref:Cof-type HAD-IIB family hydrolase n=1 Tax=Paenibacillus sp. L3-i20 TaxID=2905833 RepID=UPI001EE0374A|nr:Cof-type HAD-IIB family hydrolase [Paenibacillus sp. L3-i20]GKU79763.1 sugar phosphate phosphatase [Paenibacillus sp. L3-i20]